MCPNPHFSTLRLKKNNVDKCVQIHIFPHYDQRRTMWTNVSKSTFFHITIGEEQCGQMCPNPHFSTLRSKKNNVDKCVQIHFFLHYEPKWTNVSKSTFFHITIGEEQCGQMCPNPHFSTLRSKKNNVDKCVQIHIFLHYEPKWTNVSKSTFFHIMITGDQCGKMCPNPHFSTLWLQETIVDKCVQIHIFPHYDYRRPMWTNVSISTFFYIMIIEDEVDKCVQFPHLSTLRWERKEVDKCVQFPHLSTLRWERNKGERRQMCPISTFIHITLRMKRGGQNVSKFPHFCPHYIIYSWNVDECVQFHICPHYIIYFWNVDERGQFPILATLHLINLHVARCGQLSHFCHITLNYLTLAHCSELRNGETMHHLWHDVLGGPARSRQRILGWLHLSRRACACSNGETRSIHVGPPQPSCL